MTDLSVNAVGASNQPDLKNTQVKTDANGNPVSVYGTEIVKQKDVNVSGQRGALPSFPNYGQLKSYFGSNSAADQVQDAYQGMEARMQVAYNNFKTDFPNATFVAPEMKSIEEFRDNKKGAENYIQYLNQYEMQFNTALNNAQRTAMTQVVRNEGSKTRHTVESAAGAVIQNDNANTREIMINAELNTEEIIKNDNSNAESIIGNQNDNAEQIMENADANTRRIVANDNRNAGNINRNIAGQGELTRDWVNIEGTLTRDWVEIESDETRRIVRAEGDATRRTVREEGDETRRTVRAEGRSTRRTVR